MTEANATPAAMASQEVRQLRVVPCPDGKWYIEEYQSNQFIRGFFSIRYIWKWYRASEGFDTVEAAVSRLEFLHSKPRYFNLRNGILELCA
jgi:hypothetical protein